VIKFKAGTPGHHVLGIGLTHKNLELLKEGKPILIDGHEMGLGDVCKVIVFAGETEEALQKELNDRGMIGPETQVKPMKPLPREIVN
jgi:hypothetical protein